MIQSTYEDTHSAVRRGSLLQQSKRLEKGDEEYFDPMFIEACMDDTWHPNLKPTNWRSGKRKSVMPVKQLIERKSAAWTDDGPVDESFSTKQVAEPPAPGDVVQEF